MDAGSVIDAMERDAEDLARRIVTVIRDEVEEYRSVRDPALAAQVFAHAIAHVHAFVRCARRGRPPQGPELDFVRERGAWRARDLMPLDSLLETYLIGQRLFWETIVGAAGDTREGLLVARELTGFTFQYTHAINVAVAEAYLGEARALATEVDRARRTFLEQLLSGATTDPARAHAFGIRPDGDHTVVVVKHPGEERQAVRALERLDPFVVVRGDEVIAISRRTPAELRAELTLDVGLTAGISTLCHGLADVARGYVEARCALRHADPVAALEEVGLIDYLAHAADDTAQRLLPPGLDRLEPLAETLLAYADCDLNVARTAERLGVHPNTVHYRLRRAHDLTGRDPRRFAELVELTTALRLVA
ncbi:helix-turn-helix domain-containing protein [Solirubrobacter sp. CPCC 204708]|uniref:Helix-turn-helix domain-containing protein n=1 Tax=Solirubrobacter deserti TaxID=2282478 RepID=A0ABT4RTU5_9ACTN|nr:helix-turn-helix domain-containing protein [Solirubrobacter deserti]MBE2318688.1 helix-turn-helix domain-containing protein [Solirubrobacter deserti]MDA0142001.1 helix-turn-helix domain-containing protein [Solirubrobacter deserti]